MFGQVPGDSTFDTLVDQSVHRWWGPLSIITMVLVVALGFTDVYGRNPISDRTRWAILVAQVVLVIHIVLEVRLIDHGDGVNHFYFSGLVPLVTFLVGGWYFQGETLRSAKILLVLLLVGTISVTLADSLSLMHPNSWTVTNQGPST